MNAEHLYGIPERANTFTLNSTVGKEPYRLFNQDKFPHDFGTNSSLYGSIPYLLAHSAYIDASVAWMNAAETYVSLVPE